MRGRIYITLMSAPTITWPWEAPNWPARKRTLTTSITSIVDLDGKIAMLTSGAVPNGKVRELFQMLEEAQAGSTAMFITDLLPTLQKLIKGAPGVFRRVRKRVLIPGVAGNVALSRLQAATLTAFMFFGMFDGDYLGGGAGTTAAITIDDMPDPSLAGMWTRPNAVALRCVIEYFRWVHESLELDAFTSTIIIIKRTPAAPERVWQIDDTIIGDVLVGDGTGGVDDDPGRVRLCAISDYPGDTTFTATNNYDTAVMQQPECMLIPIFCAKLAGDVITVVGAMRLSTTAGIGMACRRIGDYDDAQPISRIGAVNIISTAVIFADPSPETTGPAQFRTTFLRDLQKLYTACLAAKSIGAIIVADHWQSPKGNNPHVKLIQLIMAAAASGITLAYYPNAGFAESTMAFTEAILTAGVAVGDLYDVYNYVVDERIESTRLNEIDIFEAIIDRYNAC